MNAMKLFLPVIVLFFSVSALHAQNRKLQEKADALFENQEFYSAAGLYEKLAESTEADDEKALFAEKAGDCYAGFLDYSKAVRWYQTAFKITSDLKVEDKLAEMLLAVGQYAEADIHYSHLIKNSADKSKYYNRSESCRFAAGQMLKVPSYEIVNVQELNSPFSEYSPVFSNGRVLFTSARTGRDSARIFNFDGQGFSDIYQAQYDSSMRKWINITKLPNDINGKFNEGTVSLNSKTEEMLFMRCNEPNGKGKICRIYSCRIDLGRNDASKVAAMPLGSETYSVGHPALNSTGEILFFVSDNPEGIGGKDLYVTHKKPDGNWSKPENCGAKINTVRDEMFPVISGDTLLYFASSGRIGMGGLDIYAVEISGNRITGEVVGMPYPVNSAGDDFGYFPLNAENGLFASNRAGGNGMDDIYLCKPVPFVLSAKGKVTDKTSGLPITKALVIVKLNGEVTDTTLTDASGEYFITNILCDRTYQIDAVKEGYMPQTKTLVTIGEKNTRELSAANGHDIDFELFRITRDEIAINNIYYDFDKWDLREESKRELDKIVELLNENPGMRIQLNSHTDDRGPEIYNVDLSQKRAQSVVEYLIQQGIDQKRLLFKGWGESKLMITNAQSEEEHQMNRRTTFNILNAGDYGDKYFENLYAEIDKGIQKSRAHMFFRVFFGTKGEPAFDENYNNIRQWFPGTNILTVKEDGMDRYYMGAYIFMDEAMDALTQLKSKGLTDCYIAAFRDENKIGVVKLQ